MPGGMDVAAEIRKLKMRQLHDAEACHRALREARRLLGMCMFSGRLDKDLTWEKIRALRDQWPGRLIVKGIEKQRFKLVFCVESRVLNFMKWVAPIGTLKLMRRFVSG